MSEHDRVTMADVARDVGVSMMTVSRVVNEKGDVSPETRQRVLAAVERLGYRPSSIARGLATRHTGTLGLVVPDVANPFFAEVARGVEHIAYANGYNVFLCNTDEDPERELDVLGSLEEKRVDGIVLCSSRLEPADLALVVTSHPAVVLVNRRLDSADHPVHAVLVDDELGGRLAAQHLLRRGHRTIGFLSGPPGSRSGRGRLAGYRSALSELGVSYEAEWVRGCAPVADAGRDGALALLTLHPELTALLCYNDLVAVGVLRAADELGRQVPDDLAVVGFDDIPLAALITPRLTTCRVARHELGVRAVRLLLDQINGDGDRLHRYPAPDRDRHQSCIAEAPVTLEPELIVRESAP